MNSISIKKAAIINAISKYSTVIIQLLFNAILARLLSPDDYGVVAVITVFTTFFYLFADMGFGTAIIQNKTLDNDDNNSIFSFTIILGIVLGLSFIVFSFGIAFFYNDKVYILLGIILSFSIILNSLNIVPNALLMKKKEFKLIAIRGFIVSVVVGIITIIFAFLGLKYYALAIQSVLVSFFTFIWNYYSVPLKIVYKINKSSINKIKSYSTYQFAFNFINYFSRNLDNLLIGKLLGNNSLAYYDKAYKTMKYPIDNISSIISPILHPIFSEMQNDKNYIYNQYVKIIKFLSLIGVFISVFCFYSAEEIIIILYGKQWISAIDAFKILAISVGLQMSITPASVIFQSTNNTKLLFKNGVFNSVVAIIGIIIGLIFGKIEYVAIGVFISVIFSFINTYINAIKKCLNESLFKFFTLFIPEIMIMLIMYIFYNIVFYNVVNLFSVNGVIVLFFIKGILLFIIYFICLILFKQIKYLNIVKR